MSFPIHPPAKSRYLFANVGFNPNVFANAGFNQRRCIFQRTSYVWYPFHKQKKLVNN
jgi:hypothetical protein